MRKTCGPVFVVTKIPIALIYRRRVRRPNVKMLSTPLISHIFGHENINWLVPPIYLVNRARHFDSFQLD